MDPVVSPLGLESVLGEVIGPLRHIRIVGRIQKGPGSVLDNNFVGNGVLGRQRRVCFIVGSQMSPELGVGAEERPELLQVPEEGRRFVVVRQAGEVVDASFSFADKIVEFEQLAGRRVGFAHHDSSVRNTLGVDILEDLILRVSAAGSVEA